jgi:Bacterial Ig domain
LEIGAIANNPLARGDVRELVLQATDPDGNPLKLTLSTLNGYALPSFVTFTDNGNGTALLRVAPGDGDRGDYTLTLTAADNGDGGGAGAIQSVSTSFVVSVGRLVTSRLGIIRSGLRRRIRKEVLARLRWR